jgi:hypothetical protein
MSSQLQCQSSDYDNTGLTYDSVESFLQVCEDCFGDWPTLTDRGECWYDTDGQLVLAPEWLVEARKAAYAAGDADATRLCDRALAGCQAATDECRLAYQ